MMDLVNAFHQSTAGMKAQGDRLRVVAQNIANSESTAQTPGGAPYRRKVISFKNSLDKELGIERVQVSKYGVDKSDFQKKYDPGHPAADEEGYVLMPNVNPMVEMIDMREAQRAYEANINTLEVSKTLLQQTINMLR